MTNATITLTQLAERGADVDVLRQGNYFRDMTHLLDQGVQTDHSHGFQQSLVREPRSPSLGEGRG